MAMRTILCSALLLVLWNPVRAQTADDMLAPDVRIHVTYLVPDDWDARELREATSADPSTTRVVVLGTIGAAAGAVYAYLDHPPLPHMDTSLGTEVLVYAGSGALIGLLVAHLWNGDGSRP